MANVKVTRSRKTRTRRKAVPYRQALGIPEIKGKIIADVELFVSSDDYSIIVNFQDKTSLSFDVEPCVSVMPELSDWKTGEYKPLKRWRPIHSTSSRLW